MPKAMGYILAYIGSIVAGLFFYTAFYSILGSDFNAFLLYKHFRSEWSGKVVIVKIDNESLDALAKTDLRILTFPKQIYLDLFDRLEKAKAKAIGMDIVFANADEKEQFVASKIRSYGNIILAAKVGVSENQKEQILPRSVYDRVDWGMIDMLFDTNIVTKIPPLFSIDHTPIEHFSLKVFRRFLGDTTAIGEIKNGVYQLSPIHTIPLDQDGNIIIPFFKKPHSYPSISLKDVLAGNYDPEFFRDKIVLIGEYWTLIHDEYFSPVSFWETMPGVEFHANMIDGLLTNKFLISLNFITLSIVAVILSLLTFYTILRSRFITNIIYILFFPLLLVITSWYMVLESGIMVNLFFIFLVGFLFPIFWGTLYRYFILDAKRRYISQAFSHYIAPEIVSQISTSANALTLGWEKKKITIFFSDIADFTTITETLWTDKLFALMGEYLSEMTDILVKNSGTLDKYIGDAIMGFFGAPLPIAEAEFLACKTALEQQARLSILSEKWQSQGLPLVQARIGINAWEAMIGNIGSKNRFNYTAIGDSVNLASRLEWVNKLYGTFICVSEEVFKKTEKHFLFRKLDRIRVKGKMESVTIYELLGFANDTSIDTELVHTYEWALELYFMGKFKEAKELFATLKNDPPSQTMLERLDILIHGNAKLENGVYALMEK